MEFMLYISWVKVMAWIERTLVRVEEGQRCVNEHGVSSSAPCVPGNPLYTLGFVNFTVDSIKKNTQCTKRARSCGGHVLYKIKSLSN